MDNKIMKLVYTALLTAIVAIVTMAIPLPSPAGGFYNIGDSMVMISALLLGPVGGAVAGGLGSGLADFYLGYGAWVPWTFVIKGLEGLVIGFIAHKKYRNSEGKSWLAFFIPACIFGVAIIAGGYWIAYGVMSSSFEAAAVEIPGNIIQGSISAVIATILGLVLRNRLNNKNSKS